MGIQDHTSKALTKSQQQHETEEQELPEAAEQPKESPPVPGTWPPLLVNVCLCTALALSAYVCYRAYFHWCLSFLLLFVPPCLSTDVAKWTRLANQPALTLGLRVDYLDFSRLRFTRLFYKCSVRGWLVANNKLPILVTHPNPPILSMSSWMLRASVFQVSHPKYVCWLKHRLNRQYVTWSVEESFSSPVLWTWMNGPFYMSPLLLTKSVCVLPFHPLLRCPLPACSENMPVR